MKAPAILTASVSTLVLGLALLVPQASAETYDADLATTGAQDGGGLGWNTTNLNWGNGAADVAWPNLTTSAAIFGAGSGAAGTVNVTANVNANSITFNATGSRNYTLYSRASKF